MSKPIYGIPVGVGGGSGDSVQSDWNQQDATQADYIKNKLSIENGYAENTVQSPLSEAYDGYAVSLGYENMTVPFKKDADIEDHSALLNADIQVDADKITFNYTTTDSGYTAKTNADNPITLYYDGLTENDVTISMGSYEGARGDAWYSCQVIDGRLRVELYGPTTWNELGETWIEGSVPYSITYNYCTPSYFGFRYESISKADYVYVREKVTKFPYSYSIDTSDIEKDETTGEHSIDINYLIPQTEAGDYASVALGYASVSGGMGATTSGYRNVSIGNGTFTGGYHNKTISDTGASVGCNNINYGNASFVGGTGNTNNTGNTIVHGSNNIVEKYNSDSAIFGHNNIAEENKNVNTSNLCAGKGNTLKSTTRATAVFGTSNIVDTTNSLVAGYENTVGGNQNIVGGYRNNVKSTISIVSGSSNNSQSTASATFGNNNTNTGNYAFVAGNGNNSSGEASITLGLTNTNTGKGSFVVGEGNVNNNGGRIIVAGRSNTIDGIVHGSAVFGCGNIVKDGSSFANAESAVLCAGKLNTVETRVGFSGVIGHNNTLGSTNNVASIQGNAVFGGYNKLVANYSFISGSYNTIDSNINNSFVAGTHCYAGRSAQRVFGQYNVANTSSDSVRYVDIVGWGSESEPKNIYTLDTEGNASFTGTVTANGATLATEDYVDNALKDIDLSNYVTKEYLDEKLTQIENVVDRILEIQNSLIGGKQ